MWRFHQLVLAVAASFLLSVPMAASSASELRRVIALSRHGSRAPNEVVEHICPNNAKNLEAYHVPVEQLTEYGMEQLLKVGEHTRNVYVDEKKFLSPTLNGNKHAHFETYFRSDAATRCSQSATALGYGLYPDGTGPPGFTRQPVPVTMQLLKNEHDFAAPKGPCKQTLVQDMIQYANTRATELLVEYKDAIDKVSELCGVNIHDVPTIPGGEDIVLAVKDIADMIIFDRQQKLPPLAGLTPELSAKLEQLAFTNLMERYYSTDRTITYWNGGFPDLLLRNLAAAANPNSPSPKDYRFYSYHGHRELLHGLAKMLGWNINFEGLPMALNMSSLHPGTTMFFELHAHKSVQGEDYTVQTFMWSPQTPREQIKLDKCSSADCPLDEFTQIIKDHIARTGTWQEICNYHEDEVKDVAHLSTGADGSPTADADVWDNAYLVVLSAMLGLGLVFGIVNAVLRMRNFRRDGYRNI